MSGASNSTPAQDGISSPAAPRTPTSLFSLPNELLIRIAREVAPDGGRKAGNLRLVCGRLGGVLATVTWASIVLPTDLAGLDEIGDELLNNRTGHNSLVISVRYNKPAFQPRVIVQALKALSSLRRLHLAGTLADGGLFDFGGRKEPFSFELTGATKLFTHSLPNDPGAPVIVRILNWVALGPLSTLTLPVFGTFFANDVLATLSLPRVKTLVLDVDPTSLATPVQDLLPSGDSLNNYAQLVRFLKLASTPSLSTLHLRGWFDRTGVVGIGNTPIHDLPADSPLIFSLLGFLRTTTVVELRLENSLGHEESDVQSAELLIILLSVILIITCSLRDPVAPSYPTRSLRSSLSTPLTKLFGIKHPVLLAGMGGAAGPELTAAVTNAGGLGVIGGVGYTPKQLRDLIQEVKDGLVDKNAPFGVDLLLPALDGNARKTNRDYTGGKLNELVDICIEAKIALFVCAIGVPPVEIVQKFHRAGIPVANMRGVDIIIAQGSEGGGHTGDVPTSILIPACVNAVQGKKSPLTGNPILVLAAGGIHDGKGLAAALAAGAVGVWVGTRFVCAEEAGASKYHQDAIISTGHSGTIRTLIYSGRPLRVKKTAYVSDWEENRQEEIASLTAKGTLPHETVSEEKEDSHALLMGAVSAMIHSVEPAKKIVESMVASAVEELKRTASYITAGAKL
ncbi:hypothetical protein RQP46_005790 [Phenoliferia psychrophenolica]